MDESKLDSLRDFPKFAAKFLIISTKGQGTGDGTSPFILNRAQLFTHARLEAQLKATGKVRALILKGRQMGLSTMIQGRFFHKIVTKKGNKAFVLAHESDATDNLFKMTRRFYDNLEDGLCPKATKLNMSEMEFDQFKSSYKVGTAGNKKTGRSQTVQLFHGCLADGSKVFDPVTGGLMNIEEFLVGDNVLTHTGEIAKISFISSQRKECLEVVLRGLTAFPLVATPNHRFFTKEGWKRLENFKSDEVIGYPIRRIEQKIESLELPRPPKRIQGGGRQSIVPDSINVDYNLGRLMGLYLAEGHLKVQRNATRYPSSISFIIHRKETQRTIEWISPFSEYFTTMNVTHREDSLTSVVTIYGNRFASLVNNICGRTFGKHLPLNWYEYGNDFCKGLLHGYISGDGHSDDECRRVRASSICSAITISMRDMAASLGYGWASIEFKPAGIRHGRNEKERYTFSLCGDGASHLAEEIDKITPKVVNQKTSSVKKYAATTTEISNGYAWLRLNSISYAGMRDVYDFEVDHIDHSYCTIHGGTHNSEVGFWENTDDLSTGMLQAVSSEPGTEIILESTANGIGNFFHSSWQDAVQGKSEYQAIFAPWYWQPEYSMRMEGAKLTEDEELLLTTHGKDGLTLEHLIWRRIKTATLNKDDEVAQDMFKQEYPFTAVEAFLNPVKDSFIRAKYVNRARINDIQTDSALIIGVDPAISDNDRTAIIRRTGRRAYNLQTFRNHNTMEIVGKVRLIIDQEKPKKVFIDCIGIGAGVVDRLQEMGYQCVEGINVARTANDKERFANQRAEIWADMRDWLMQNELPVEIPDSDDLHGDLCSLGYKHRSNGQLILESKADLRRRGMPSCDTADALALTFAIGQHASEGQSFYVKPPEWERGKFI